MAQYNLFHKIRIGQFPIDKLWIGDPAYLRRVRSDNYVMDIGFNTGHLFCRSDSEEIIDAGLELEYPAGSDVAVFVDPAGPGTEGGFRSVTIFWKANLTDQHTKHLIAEYPELSSSIASLIDQLSYAYGIDVDEFDDSSQLVNAVEQEAGGSIVDLLKLFNKTKLGGRFPGASVPWDENEGDRTQLC